MSGEILLEEGDRPLPSELRSRLVVTWRRVVVKAVLGAGVNVRLVAGVIGFESRLVRRPQRVDALVVLGVVDQQRRLDRRHGRGLGRGTVEWDGRLEIGPERDRQVIGRAAAPTETRDAELARGGRVVFE